MRAPRLTTIAAVAVVSAGLSAVGTHFWAVASAAVPHYTGCLVISGTATGTIDRVAQGAAPTSPCGVNEKQIQFSNGTITGVKAGTGLTGGGTNGNVALRVAPAYRLPTTCSAGQILNSTGPSEWTCGADAIRGTGVVDHGSVTIANDFGGTPHFVENALGQFSGVCSDGATMYFDTKLAVSTRITWSNKDGVASTTFQGAQLTPLTTADYAATVQVLWADGQVETAFVTQHVDPDTHACTFTGQEMLG
ncbi:MAG TPA: hypothetical protein VGB19_08165 [Actinomycetota bacterium]